MRAVRCFVVLLTVASSLWAVPAASAAAAVPGGVYTPLPTPARILDTRTDVGGHHLPFGPNETVTVAVPNLPPDATAVAINLTGTGGTASTYLSTFPIEDSGTSTLNLAPGQTAAVAAFVTLGRNRSFNIRNNVGTVDVIVDVAGYFATGSGAAFVSAPSPTRILDTRTDAGGHSGPLRQGETMTLPVRGQAGVPATATAVVINQTGVAPTAGTYLGATPDGGTGTSTLNLDPDTTRANLAVVAIGNDGAIRIFNHSGSTHAVADVQGWFGPETGGRYVALPAPRRVVDSRTDTGPLGPGATRTVSFAGSDIPGELRVAVLFNLTGVFPTASTFLTASPHSQPRPLASNVNLAPGAIVPNAAISDSSTVDIFNNAGATDIVADLTGYFYFPLRPNPTVPVPPSIISARALGDQVEVDWYPNDDGGLPVTRYTITVEPGGRSVTVDGNQTEARIPGFSQGVYAVSITATNFIGTSVPSPPSIPLWLSPLTRVDTDAAGVPDQAGFSAVDALSADGRYALLAVQTFSNMVPAPYRTPDSGHGWYVLRKDIQTGEVILAGVNSAGEAVRAIPSAAISPDGMTFVYPSRESDGSRVLYVRDVANNTLQTIPLETGATNVALSADGQWLTWLGSANEPAGRRIYRHDLHTHQTNVVLNCDTPSSGCYIETGPVVSSDGKQYLVDYTPRTSDPARLTLVDADTGALRTLPEGGSSGTYTFSGDGRWVFYALYPRQLKKIATAPGASPIDLRSWNDVETWVVNPTSANEDGTLLAFFRQVGNGRSGKWYGTSPAYLLDLPGDREIRMPDPKDVEFSARATISANGRAAILENGCVSGVDCTPTGTYSVALP